MGIILTLIIGLVVGLIAKALMPGRDPGGFVITALLGIAGAFLAFYAGQAMGIYASGEPAGFIASVLGAMALLGIFRAVSGRRLAAHRP